MVRRSQLSVAAGLAAAFHAYLTNAIVGVDQVSRSHVDELKVYKTRNCLEEDRFTRISDKLFVLFPESERVRHGVAELVQLERRPGEALTVVSETLRHSYEMAGQKRLSVLHVLKVHQHSSFRNKYFVFAENRPLVALHKVILLPCSSHAPPIVLP